MAVAQQWYGLVFGGKLVHNMMLMPKIVKLNKQGEPILLKNHGNIPILEYCSPSEAQSRAVKEWATKQDVMAKMDTKVKAVLNEVKSMIRSKGRQVLIVYHRGDDPCSMCPNNHYHILVSSAESLSFANEYHFRKIRQLCKPPTDSFEADEPDIYIKSQKIRSLSGIVNYLMKPPRVWYGTNSKEIFTIRRDNMTKDILAVAMEELVSDVDISEILGSEAQDATTDGWGPCDMITSADSIEAPPTTSGIKRKWDDFDDFNAPDADTPVSISSVTKGDRGQESSISRLTDILVYIMKCCKCTDRALLKTRSKTLELEGHPSAANFLARLKNIDYNRANNHIYTTAARQYKFDISNMELRELMLRAASDADYYDDKKYLDVYESVDLFTDWLDLNNWNIEEFIDDLFSVLNRDGGKKNCMFIYGPSNCGKTVMFTKPLEAIMINVGRINNINQTGQFVFENCVSTRLISIEECAIPKHFLEDMKKILGGEECQVGVKYIADGALLQPTPVICTSNREPWVFSLIDEEPLRNRLRYYTCTRSFDRLADYADVKINPLIYVLLWNAWYTSGQSNQADSKIQLSSIYGSETGRYIDLHLGSLRQFYKRLLLNESADVTALN